MPPPPAVTVLMAVHNGLPYLPIAVESVLSQTWEDFELLVIEDGSTDDSGAYLAGLRDRRVRVIRNASNLGLTVSLNRGLERSVGTYVARMDADDVAHPERLHTQVAFLSRHPEVGIVGSAFQKIDSAGRPGSHVRPPVDDLGIRWLSLIASPFAHPTVMLRTALLTAHRLRYDTAYGTAQDYDLWVRLLDHARGANLEEPLLSYRVHHESISGARTEDQQTNSVTIAQWSSSRQLNGFTLTRWEVIALRRLFLAGDVRGTRAREAAYLARRYADLIDAFHARHSSAAGVGALRRRVYLQILHVLLTASRTRNAVAPALRVLIADPALVLEALGAAGRQIRAKRPPLTLGRVGGYGPA